MQNRIYGNLVIENEERVVKGNLSIVGGTIIMTNANLVVEGDLTVFPECSNIDDIANLSIDSITIVNGGIYAKSISTLSDIVIKNGNITTFADLNCENIYSDGGDVNVGGDANVANVYCKNYLVDGNNDSYEIEADCSVYILGTSSNHNISAPEVFIGEDSYFYSFILTANYFETGGHVINCLYRQDFVEKGGLANARTES